MRSILLLGPVRPASQKIRGGGGHTSSLLPLGVEDPSYATDDDDAEKKWKERASATASIGLHRRCHCDSGHFVNAGECHQMFGVN